MANQVSFNWLSYSAVLFDLDGVVTPTAKIHEQAWAKLFSDYDYLPEDYLAYIDGKPRYEGVATFLASRNIELPWGKPDDRPGRNTVCAMGNTKNDVFLSILERDEIKPYCGTLAVMDLLDEHGITQAIVSSSKNARPVLDSAGLADRFEVVVDGITAVEEGLAGKPDPAMFRYAADAVDFPVAQCVVVEDAVAGVKAGVGGGFGYVLGIDRGGNRNALAEAGAHSVVADVGEAAPMPTPDPDK